MRDIDRQRLTRQGFHDAVVIYRKLARAIERTRAWTDDGYPTGGTDCVRGGDTDPLPLRKALAGPDTIAAKLFELDRSLTLWAEAAAEIRAFIAWTETSAKHEDDRPTLTCRHCGRTILDGWDALYQRPDRPKAGLCTYRIDRHKGQPDTFIEGGCHAAWLEAKRETDRVRQARWRANQQAVTHHESADGTTCHAPGATMRASVDPTGATHTPDMASS